MGTESLYRLLNDNVSIVQVASPPRRNYTFTLQQATHILAELHSLRRILLRNQHLFFKSFTALPSISSTLKLTNKQNGGP